MKKKGKVHGYLIVVNRGGTQRTESGGGMNGIHRRFMLWGIKSAMVRFLRERQREDKERRGEGFARRGRRAAAVSPREEKERGRGGSGTGTRMWDREPTGC